MAKKTSLDTFKQVMKEFTAGKLKPVYLLYGEEEFFVDQLQETAISLVPESQRDFNLDVLYGQDISPARALEIARSYPMMAERRILIIRNFLKISKNLDEEETNGGHINDFVDYFNNPNPSTLLLLIDPKKPPGNTIIGREAKKNKSVGFYEFSSLPDYLLPDWVMDWGKDQFGKKIEPPAAQLLAQFVGSNLQLLSTEIDKVCTFVDTSDTVTQSDVKKIIGSYREYTVFELKDAVTSRNLEQSLGIAEQMLQQSKNNTGELIRTVGFFYSVFVNIWQIRRLAETGNTKQQVQAAMGVNSNWYFNTLWQDASNFHLSEMPRIFEALFDADRALKGFSTLDPTTILFLLVQRIID